MNIDEEYLHLFNTDNDYSDKQDSYSTMKSSLQFQWKDIDNGTSAPLIKENFCKLVLYDEIDANTRIRIWDLSILIPNILFLVFMLVRCNKARLKLRATNSPIFSTFYILVALNAAISVLRCIVAMTVNATIPIGEITDKILWVIVRCFLLATEISVLIFGLAFGHLDSQTSIRRVLLVTSLLSSVYSGLQGVLEITAPDENFIRVDKKGLFGHGGMLFWFISSIIFSLIYLIVLILPWTKLREKLALPTKPSFYWYILFLDVLNISQAVGSGLLYYREENGLCVSQPSIMFSYKAQVDDAVEDDNVSLPHQLSCSSLKTDSDYIYQNNSLYDSTHFDAVNVNPLYIHSLQSPDSLNGFEAPSVTGSINSSPAPQQQYQQTPLSSNNKQTSP
ncbi:transmembrane protein adipocyte-associated 1 isoform X2 [Parasteatoda tepidariorum]|uniref:transmembrane protein adipocyte-associated 1 isoform X2 n=1 Tax=Parasteatoda tepidariorum TaxID=114398 RepID=UPI00077F9B7E|nr:transmembrane protein adipocyte-associated 1 isoform X2 [Parasteatoda tepidariorum]